MPSDKELLSAWAEGDGRAGNELFNRHFKPVYRFFRNKVTDDVDDLVQQTFLACLKGAKRFEGKSSFRTYMFQAARFIFYRHIEKRTPVDPSVSSLHDVSPTASAILVGKGQQRLLLEALRRIPIHSQVALELYYFEGMTAPQVAEALELNENTARGRITKGVMKLRKVMAEIAASPDVLESTTTDLEAWAHSLKALVGPGAEDVDPG